MLVLTRKNHERIQIGENISITITRIKGNTVQLGIEAPKQIRVLRAELLESEPETLPLGEIAVPARKQAEATLFETEGFTAHWTGNRESEAVACVAE